jgi:TP901 family phage tail tape measure protein
MPSIADLFISVSSDVSGAISGLSQVDQKVNGTTQSMASAVPVALAFAGAATAVGAGFVDAIGAASSFDAQINGIKAVMSPTEVLEFGDAVRELALRLGADTKYSAEQAANAIEEMIKAGVPLPAIMSGAARSALDLAAATGVDVTTAAGLASTAMNTYHQSASALPGIMDTIANASNATALSVDGLKFGLAAVGPVAAGIGLSFTDTAVALGVFANNGLIGSDAGTSLKTMLLNLEPSTKAQTAAFAALNLLTADGKSKFFDASGAARSMSDIFQILRDSTVNLTNEQKINLLQTAFGTDAVRAATIAANEGAAGWATVTDAMDKMGGTQIAAAQRMQGLAGATEQMNGSISTLKISIGEQFQAPLIALTGAITGLINGFLQLDPSVQSIVVAVVGAAGAFAGLSAAFVLLGPLVTSIVAGMGIMLGVVASVAAPLLAIAAAAALLYEAWQTDFGGIQEVTQQVWEEIQPAFVNIQNFLGMIKDALGPAFQGASEAAAPFIQLLSDALRPVLAQLPGLIKATGDEFNAVGEFIGRLVTIFQALVAAFTTDAGAMGIVIAQIRAMFGDTVADTIEPFIQAFMSAIPTIKEVAGAFLDFAETVRTAFVQLFSGDFSGAWNTLVEGLGTLTERLAPAWASVTQFLADRLGELPGFLAGVAGDLWAWLVNSAWEIAPRLGDAFANWLNFVGAALSDVLPGIITGAGDIFGALINAAWDIGPRIGEAFGNFLGFIGEALSGLPNFIAGLGDLFGPFVNAAWALGNSIGDAIASVLGFIGEAIGSIPGLLGSFDIFGGIIDQAGALLGRLGAALDPIKQYLADTFGAFWTFLTSGTLPVAPAGGGGGGTTPLPTGGGGGPLVYVANVNASSPEEASAFLDLVAQAVLASARRVTPPTGGANPALA